MEAPMSSPCIVGASSCDRPRRRCSSPCGGWRSPTRRSSSRACGTSTPTDDIEDSLGFKIVTGKGTLVIPGVQTVRRLSLDLREAELAIDCVTHQGIPLGIRGVVIYKVGDDFALDRQRRPPLPRPAGPHGPAGPQRVRRPPPGHRRQHDRRGDDPRPGEADPAHPRVLGHRDGEARPDRRLAADPGDRRPHRLHRQPRPAPRRRRRRATPASPRPPPTARPPSGSRRPRP